LPRHRRICGWIEHCIRLAAGLVLDNYLSGSTTVFGDNPETYLPPAGAMILDPGDANGEPRAAFFGWHRHQRGQTPSQ
jgi:hypothetical protein